MKNKFISLFILLFLSSYTSFAQTQSEYLDGVSKLISWFSNIDNVLTDISDKEKIKRIYRQLGYVSEDIDNIALGKQLLATDISKLSNASKKSDLDKLKPQIDDIVSDINKLIGRLEAIKTDVSQTDQTVVSDIIQTIKIGFMNRKRYYLDDIEDYLNGKNIALTKIKDEALQAKQIADEAAIKIKEAKIKIKAKLG
jgi:hypothetical protein